MTTIAKVIQRVTKEPQKRAPRRVTPSVQTISSQRYLNDAIVAEKRRARDYDAFYVTVKVEGRPYRVVTDGHHSIAAAKLDGVAVRWHKASRAIQQDADFLGGDAYLAAHQEDSDWYDVSDGSNVW